MTLNVLQWNPHWECFTPGNAGTCWHHALGALSSILSDLKIDFANIIEINERSDFYAPPAPWRIETARCGNPAKDSTSLIYNSRDWSTVEYSLKGCMEHIDRPFMVQAFKHTSTQQKVIVVGAHFPHRASNGKIRDAVTAAMQRHPDALGVIFAADVNRESHTSTEAIMRGDVLPGWAGGKVLSAQHFPSCCHNDGFVHHYDRIGTTFGQLTNTQMLFNPHPWWTNIPGSSFHKAVHATIEV